MQNDLKAAVTMRLVLSVLLIGFIASCENPGSVGSSIIPQPDIVFDTLIVSGFEPDSVVSSTGNLTYVPIGKYNDQLFGDLEAIGYFKPIIDFTLDRVFGVYDVQFLIELDSVLINGDTASTSTFSLFEIEENWRGNELSINEGPAYNEAEEIATFSISDESQLFIDLPRSWENEFATFFEDTSSSRDSVFNADYFGFSIVQTSETGKINTIVSARSKLAFIDNSEADTVLVDFQDWGYTFERINETRLPNRLLFHSTLEQFYHIDLSEIAGKVEPKNILRAELVLYVDQETLNSTLLPSHSRIETTFLDVNYNLTFENSYELQFLSSELRGFEDEVKQVFRFDVTNLIENYVFNNREDRILYVSLNPAGGILRSTIFFNETNPGREPKLIITTTKNVGQ